MSEHRARGDELLGLGAAELAKALEQGDPRAEFHLRRAEVAANLALGHHLRGLTAVLEAIAAATARGADRIGGASSTAPTTPAPAPTAPTSPAPPGGGATAGGTVRL